MSYKDVLSVEKSIKLSKLDIKHKLEPTFWWARRVEEKIQKPTLYSEWFLSTQKSFMTPGLSWYETIPAYTISDLIEILKHEELDIFDIPNAEFFGTLIIDKIEKGKL